MGSGGHNQAQSSKICDSIEPHALFVTIEPPRFALSEQKEVESTINIHNNGARAFYFKIISRSHQAVTFEPTSGEVQPHCKVSVKTSHAPSSRPARLRHSAHILTSPLPLQRWPEDEVLRNYSDEHHDFHRYVLQEGAVASFSSDCREVRHTEAVEEGHTDESREAQPTLSKYRHEFRKADRRTKRPSAIKKSVLCCCEICQDPGSAEAWKPGPADIELAKEDPGRDPGGEVPALLERQEEKRELGIFRVSERAVEAV